MIEISEGGVGILSEVPIETESRVFISLYLISEDPISGIPVWSHYIEKEGKYYYRIGFETQNLDLEKIKDIGFPKRSEAVREILSQTTNRKSAFPRSLTSRHLHYFTERNTSANFLPL